MTLTVVALAKSAVVIAAVIWLALTYVVVRELPPHLTVT